MTVVSYLRLSKDSGMGCADERETHRIGVTHRAYDVFPEKIRIMEGLPIFVGGSGSVSDYIRILEMTESRSGQDFTYEQVLQELKKAYKEVRIEEFDDYVFGKYSIQPVDLAKGGLDPDIKREVKEALDTGRYLDEELLLGGFDMAKEEFRIYRILYPGVAIFYPRSTSIGAGSDISDIVIGTAIANLKPADRNKIEKYLGARILMEATQAAWRNLGVGGRTQLVWTEKDVYHELGDAESNLLNNALVLEKRGHFDRSYVDTVFQRVIGDNTKADELMTEMRKALGREFYKIILVESQIQ